MSFRCARSRPHGWAALLLILSVTACGYHLRGSRQAVVALPPVHVGGDRSLSLYPVLRQALQDAGATLVDAGQARLVVLLRGERSDRRVLSVGGNARVEEYELIYTATFEVLDGTGRVLLPLQTLRKERGIRFRKEAVNAIDSEVRQVQDDLRAAAVREILQRLQGVAHAMKEQGP